MDDIKIISAPTAENPFVVLYKPAGLPSAPLDESDSFNAFAKTAALFPELRAVCGKKDCEHGLLHRLDTATRGLLVIGATQEAYEALILAQKSGLFEKTYTATVDKNSKCLEGFPAFPIDKKNALLGGKWCSIESYFRPFGKKGACVRPVAENSGMAAKKKCGKKIYRTKILIAGNTATCKISEGYRHQVRCHLAWAGFAVKGDELYNAQCTGGELCFEATSVQFPHPLSAKTVFFSV